MSMTTTATVLSPSSVVMRAARGSDGVALAQLARLDSKRPPRGEVLVAEVDGVIDAALQLDDGASFANPFKPTAGLVELLELRAGDAERRRVRRGLAERLRLRPAPRARAA
jgi:hypothetical protein